MKIFFLLITFILSGCSAGQYSKCSDMEKALHSPSLRSNASEFDAAYSHFLASCNIQEYKDVQGVTTFELESIIIENASRSGDYEKGIKQFNQLLSAIPPFDKSIGGSNLAVSTYGNLFKLYDGKAKKNSRPVDVYKEYVNIIDSRGNFLFVNDMATLDIPAYQAMMKNGDTSAKTINDYAVSLNTMPDAKANDYRPLLDFMANNKDYAKSYQQLQQQYTLLQASQRKAEAAYPFGGQSDYNDTQANRYKLIADVMNEKGFTGLGKTSADIAGRYVAQSQYMAALDASNAQAQIDNQRIEAENEAKNQQLVSSLVGAATGIAVAASSGQDVMQATGVQLNNVAIATSDDPEQMQSIQTALTSAAGGQSSGRQCTFATASKFKSCCKSGGGKVRISPGSDGETSYTCVTGRLHETCNYIGERIVGQCGMEDR
ncbi:hypothetical protein [Pantoea phytobeneficialis]|uniref:Lipoprotein n=2 Tax=Pantoea phytobeneficialis TaxID=2052056 RepID=A0ABT8XTJ2_9GAMM|nr:hypothetical protein [Pantoea phytobeneficialis]MDO6406785.1 hypothetical protein [Pantoea phytobeneficialis]